MLHKAIAEFENLKVAYWAGGGGPPLLLIHGSGPGASTLGNWRLILDKLARHFSVVAVDLIGFGHSDRKGSGPFFDLALWQRQARWAAHLFADPAPINVLAHSLSGPLALRLAAANPHVARVMTTGTMGMSFPLNDDLARVWTFPRDRAEIRRAGETVVFDPSVITEEFIDGRAAVLHDGSYEGYFNAMFDGDKQQYITSSTVTPADLAEISCPVMLVHGRDDRPVPCSATSLQLISQIDRADLVMLSRCGHSPALEHPDTLVSLANLFFHS